MRKRRLIYHPKKKKTSKIWLVIGLFFIFFGLWLLFAPQEKTSVSKAYKNSVVWESAIGQQLQRVILPKQKIDLPIVEAGVIDGYWELSESTASHGMGTANPGEAGNIVVFAHAREGMFLALKDVVIGDIVYLLTDKRWYSYQVKETKDVDPSFVEIVAPTEDETLTLYTCTGFFDSQRRVVIAKPLSYNGIK